MLIYILFFILNFQEHAFAEGRPLALVRKINGIEQLPSNLSRQLEKTTLQVVTRQPDYELLLSGDDTPMGSVVDMVAIESEVGRDKNSYRIETRLLDLKTKKLIRKASRDNIREEDLLRLFQGAIESLFIPDETKEKAPVEKKDVKAPPITPPNQHPKASTTQINPPDERTIDFRERVLALKNDVDKQIEKTVEEKEQAALVAAAAKEKPKENNPPVATIRPATTVETEVPFKKPDFSKSYDRKHTLYLGYDTRQNEASYFIATSTKVSLMTLKAQGHFPTPILDGKTAYSYDFAYSKILSSPLPFSAPYQLGLYGTYLSSSYTGSLGILRDTTFFANLTGPGMGLKEQSLSATWFRLKNEFRFDVKGPWKIGFSYGIPFQVETSYSPMKAAKKWTGNSMQFVITPPLHVKEWESALTFDKILLSSSGDRQFTLNESRIALLIRRSL